MSIQSFSIGAMAACGAVTFTNPFEVVKTRMQLQGELQPKGTSRKLYSNALSAFFHIFKNEGIQGIQKGLAIAYAYQIVLNGTRLGMYEPLKGSLQDTLDQIAGQENTLPVASMIISGATTGVAGAFLASPLFLLKTRIQSLSKSNMAVGHQHTYLEKGVLHAFSRIYQDEGIRGLYRGVDASMVRTGVGSAVQLSSYDTCKAYIQSLNLFDQNEKFGPTKLHFSASLVTSFLVCLAMNPFDVASTRMYNQKTADNKRLGALYKNGFDCIQKTIQTEGISALYKGFTAHYLRIGPHTVLTFLFLEQFKKWFE